MTEIKLKALVSVWRACCRDIAGQGVFFEEIWAEYRGSGVGEKSMRSLSRAVNSLICDGYLVHKHRQTKLSKKGKNFCGWLVELGMPYERPFSPLWGKNEDY